MARKPTWKDVPRGACGKFKPRPGAGGRRGCGFFVIVSMGSAISAAIAVVHLIMTA